MIDDDRRFSWLGAGIERPPQVRGLAEKEAGLPADSPCAKPLARRPLSRPG
jgi:hypothetical protein